MFIMREQEQGMNAVADETMNSGQIVKVSLNSDGNLHLLKVTSGGDLGGRCGMVFVDNEKKINLRPLFLNNSSLTSNENEEIAVGERVTVLYGETRGMSNQFEDGFYQPGDMLTVNTTSARWELAGSGDKVYGRVSLDWPGGTCKSQNVLLPLMFNIGNLDAPVTL